MRVIATYITSIFSSLENPDTQYLPLHQNNLRRNQIVPFFICPFHFLCYVLNGDSERPNAKREPSGEASRNPTDEHPCVHVEYEPSHAVRCTDRQRLTVGLPCGVRCRPFFCARLGRTKFHFVSFR